MSPGGFLSVLFVGFFWPQVRNRGLSSIFLPSSSSPLPLAFSLAPAPRLPGPDCIRSPFGRTGMCIAQVINSLVPALPFALFFFFPTLSISAFFSTRWSWLVSELSLSNLTSTIPALIESSLFKSGLSCDLSPPQHLPWARCSLEQPRPSKQGELDSAPPCLCCFSSWLSKLCGWNEAWSSHPGIPTHTGTGILCWAGLS